MATYLIIAAVAYLLGSIPFGYLLVRAFRGHDIRESGSGNIGATNVARSAPWLGVLTLILDAGKGATAVLVGEAIWAGELQPSSLSLNGGPPAQIQWQIAPWPFEAYFVAALFAVLGHVFPVWLRFKGGKGVATAIGGFGLIAPWAALVSILIFVAVAALGRRVSAGSIAGATVFPFLARSSVHHVDPDLTLLASGLAAMLIIFQHRDNIRRLLAGTEPRFSWRRS